MDDNQRRREFRPGPDGNAQNHQIGRELYNRDRESHQSPQRSSDNNWHSGNQFNHNQHQNHFPEDSHQRNSNADRGASLSKHYGNSEYSAYRNPNSLNYGDGRGNSTPQSGGSSYGSGRSQQGNEHFTPYGDSRGNYNARQDSYGQGHDRVHSDNRISEQRRLDDTNENYYRGAYMDSRGVRQELPRPDDNPYNEYPGTRSRYKDDDYRYGSGNHTWYEEQRYTDNNGRRADRDKGDILGDMGEGVREVWHDVKNMFSRNSDHRDQDQNRYDQDNRRNDHEYRSRNDRGTERGPRWSDETDSGDDASRHPRNNNPRYY
ncbi:hypothetical protein ACFSC6_07220 [Rufibacter sediminis]|uniref:SWFGD domain-containing protein n=1 Tax=Rufibacter sediminis TaxID=2762756 RepID=A0ABR6VYW0_9BACT|nr:hypothetical protein [Rufibacter sediminis]MBC3542077.1 hypothetical protein [Rufibacter sediminis]